ncbi:MAG TPA: phosphatidylserine/phosphatidylglycerophosphate/cardiolipin synthase family protein, partial [Nocardioides sp.]|nr:phosphatidylserine/phosphatidylglycerophosphate/cardiolipin synthase family protein [Nocardioides sp.]
MRLRRTPSPASRLMTAVRRTLLAILGAQLALALGLTVVDSYRRRGKKPKPFPVTPPRTVSIGEGTVTTYTFGRDLFADMLAAIEGAQRQILFETFIWKGDQIGERFKAALMAAADRGVEVHCIYDGFANLVVAPKFKRFPGTIKVLRYPVYTAGWRFLDLRRYGRDHRKIL